jgi:hypothetical protein
MDREESFGGASINGAKGATNDSRTTQQVCVCVCVCVCVLGWASGLSAVKRGRFKEEGSSKISTSYQGPRVVLRLI